MTDKFPRCYDVEEAGERLMWITSSRASIAPKLTLGTFLEVSVDRTELWGPALTVLQDTAIASRVAVRPAQNGRVRVAVDLLNDAKLILEVSGVVVDEDLPPVTERQHKNRARFLRQGLNLAGFHQKPFDTAIKAIERIRLFFDRSVGGGVQAADHITTNVGPGISGSSRYFSHKNDVDSKDVVPFDTEVDPKGYLAALASSTFLHTKDNVVSYVQYETDPLTGTGTYKACSPAAIKAGDIVTCKLAFMLVPMPKKSNVGWKMLNVLKAVCVMDSTVTEEANTTAVLEDLQIEPEHVEASLKRGSVSFEGTLAAPPKRSRRMSIDEGGESENPSQAFSNSALPGDFVANLDFVADFS
ncbi:uncharacterized protein SCHCODRAFT_02673438 [Schizophyllum commune H4-8]|uniref:uncharacterized protein n=1 Tax=Schizophyllum commune (strain H4-8 / FGSC 9210) TaxID=578458 RepID=UPI00215F8CDC|nr:uncharacterized protein SCHCODRAFT_02673438 [Schizophyllum commune H4-8]KAI5885726.1 hypothetical protein SCHCODRAFT_02673438 [Schizophyllum commune H4-8]